MFSPSKAVQQAAALPFVLTPAGPEVLLVSARRRARWIVPKGWPRRGLSLAKTAENEAMEEAGVRGHLHTKPVGSYRYRKRMPEGYWVPAWVLVYPVLVLEQRLDWPERSERETAWYPIGEAADLVNDEGLSRILSRLAADNGAKLVALAERLGEAELMPTA